MSTKTVDRLFDMSLTVITIVFVLGCVYSVTLIPSWIWHASDTADLSQVEKIIAINQVEYDRASERVSNIKEGDAGFRLNTDTPVASMVAAQLAFARRLVMAKVKKAALISSIIARCNGPWSTTVWLTDDVSCGTYRAM